MISHQCVHDIDWVILDAFYHLLNTSFIDLLRLVGPLGELWVVLPLAASLVVWCLICGERRGALVIVFVTIVTLVFVVLMKLAGTFFGPPWNPNWKWISTLFPSGHIAMGVVVYGALAVCVARAIPWCRCVATSLVVVLIVLLAIQRVVFDIHPILDVVGGAALGGLGLAALLRLWSSGRLHPAGLLGVAVAVALILQAFYGREVPSTEILVQIAARIHATADAVKAGLAGN